MLAIRPLLLINMALCINCVLNKETKAEKSISHLYLGKAIQRDWQNKFKWANLDNDFL